MRHAPPTPQQRALDAVGRMNPGSGNGRTALPSPVTLPAPPAERSSGRGLFIASQYGPPAEKAQAWRVANGVDDQDVVNEAMQIVKADPTFGGLVLLGSGSFNISDRITVLPACTLRGMGPMTTQVLCTSGVADYAAVGISCGYFALVTDLTLAGDGDVTHNPVGIESAGDLGDPLNPYFEPWSIVERCWVHAFGVGIRSSSPFWRILNNLVDECSDVAIQLLETAYFLGSDFPYGAQVRGNDLHLNRRAVQTDQHGQIIEGNRIEASAGTAGITSDYGILLTGGSRQQVRGNLFFNSATGADIDVISDLALIESNTCGKIHVQSGTRNNVRGNMPNFAAGALAIDLSAGAAGTVVILNELNGGAITDAGSGTARNLDGSANDWNHA